MSNVKILIVEDDPSLTEVLEYNLRQAGYEVHRAADGREGLSKAKVLRPDLILLDVMLPEMDGFEVCRRLRAEPATRDALILMLTAKSEETDQVVGLALGADDYVTKPFSVKILLERIKALRRRGRAASGAGDVVSCQGVVVDRAGYRVLVEGKPISLTRSEFRLLDTLIRQPGRVFERSALIDAALGETTIVLERTIDVHIRGLRRKLGPAAKLIETVRGVGYRFRDPSGS